MKKLALKNGNEYHITHKKPFAPNVLKKESVDKAFNFAYDMIFGEGHHRVNRSGGTNQRKKGEQFCNTFQGKIAEMAIYNVFYKNNKHITEVDFDVFGKGVWDDSDFKSDGENINIKSAAFFSNLFLLETKDWNTNGEYIPNLSNGNVSSYDYFILVRIEPDIKAIFRKERIYYSNEIEKNKLYTILVNQNWMYDIPGYFTHKLFLKIINTNFVIPQNAMLNGKIKMDASNYYLQSGDLTDMSKLFSI